MEGKVEIFLWGEWHHVVSKVNMIGTSKSFLKVLLTSMGILECPKSKRTLKDFLYFCKTSLRVCIFSHSILPYFTWTKKTTLLIHYPILKLFQIHQIFEDVSNWANSKFFMTTQRIWENIQHFLTIFISCVKIIANSDGMQILKTFSHTSVLLLLSN